MMKIQLANSTKYAIVDDDFSHIKEGWRLSNSGYAQRSGILMHRLIVNTPKGMETDHRNSNKLDNRRKNLIVCTSSQNNQRRAQRFMERGFQGVHWYKRTNRWRVALQHEGKAQHLGYFKDLKEALMAYNEEATRVYGVNARLNKV